MGKSPHPTRLFKTPEDLLKMWIDYKSHVNNEADKWLNVQYVGKDGRRVTDKPIMPLTLEGFEVFCLERKGNVGQYFDNKDSYYEDFVAICSRIRKEIRNNQITGGLLGYYNPSITQRLNNLTDITEIKQSVEVPLFPKE